METLPLPEQHDQTPYLISSAIPRMLAKQRPDTILSPLLRINCHLWFKFSSFDFLSVSLEEDNIIPTGSLEFPVLTCLVIATYSSAQAEKLWMVLPPILSTPPPLPPNRSSCFLLQNSLTRCWSGAVSLWQVILMRPRGKGVGVSDGFPVLLSAPSGTPRHGCRLYRGLISGLGPTLAESISHLSGLIH